MNKLVALAVTLCFLSASPAWAWKAVVESVVDGDTFWARREDGQRVKIRLYGVDCPESNQAFGQEAKAFSEHVLYGKRVDLVTESIDQYGRTVATVYLENTHVLQEEILRSGMAWLYGQFCRQPQCLYWRMLEVAAREGKSGLWADPAPEAPWVWRHSYK